MLNPLDYYISPDELKGSITKWSAYVLQTNFAKERTGIEAQVYKLFSTWFKRERSKLIAMDIDEANEVIHGQVLALKVEYPEAFPVDLGWWSKKQLISLYLEDRVILKDYSIQDQLEEKERIKQKKEKLLKEKKEKAAIEAEKSRQIEEKYRLKQEEIERNRVTIEAGMAFKTITDAFKSYNNLNLVEGISLLSIKMREFSNSYFSIERRKTELGLLYVITEVYKPGPKAYPNLIKGRVCLH